MKKTINGVRYDTGSALPVGKAWARGYDKTHMLYWSAKLYITVSSRRYFLHGHGGFMTIFRGAEKIIPLTDDQAEEWEGTFLHSGGQLWAKE